jgi:hypothetical protein
VRLRLIRIALALLALVVGVCSASAREKRFGYCQAQNTGARSTGCTVTVYQTGTLTLATIYADNIGTPLANPFTANATSGLWAYYADNGRYDVQFSGGNPTISPSYTLSDYLFLDLATPSNTLSAAAFISATANPSLTGVLELASGDSICWRNNANSADLCLSKNASDVFTLPGPLTSITTSSLTTSSLTTSSITSSASSPATSGFLRLAITDAINVGSGNISFVQFDGSGNPFIGTNASVINIGGVQYIPATGGYNPPPGTPYILQLTASAFANGPSLTLAAANGGPPGSRNGGNVIISAGLGVSGGLPGTVTIGSGVLYPVTFTFAALGTPSNGGIVYCSDCNIANPCTGGGTGAFAKRLAGAWVCN